MSEQPNKSEAPRDFEPVDSPEESLKYLQEGAKTAAAIMIWTKNQEHVVNSHVSVLSQSSQTFYCRSPKGFDGPAFMDDMARLGQNECFFSLSLQRANIFFKARIISVDTAGMQFKIPEKVYKVQRRKDVRFPIPDSLTLKVDFVDPLSPGERVVKKALDISASGIAFHITDEEMPVYQAGLILKDFSFTVRGKKISVSAEIRHARKPKEDANKARPSRGGACTVGVLFKGISPSDTQHIAGFVFEESRKYFSRFM